MVITIPQADLVSLGGDLYELNTETKLRADILALLDDEDGIVLEDAIRHNTEVTFAGVTYARSIEFINGYTITFEDLSYRVNLVGANNNITDVLNLNQVQVIPSNSAGLIAGTAEWTQQEKDDLMAGAFTQAEKASHQVEMQALPTSDSTDFTPAERAEVLENARNAAVAGRRFRG